MSLKNNKRKNKKLQKSDDNVLISENIPLTNNSLDNNLSLESIMGEFYLKYSIQEDGLSEYIASSVGDISSVEVPNIALEYTSKEIPKILNLINDVLKEEIDTSIPLDYVQVPMQDNESNKKKSSIKIY